jgi:hypothetical protein
MLVGELIARFRDETVASQTLISLGNLALTARVVSLAAESGVSPGEFAVQAVGQFVNAASDEDWLTLLGKMSRADDPGEVFLFAALSSAVA